MNITPNFNNKDLDNLNQQILNDVFVRTVEAYKLLGEYFISHSRPNVGFTDQTGNLRSSIGYMLFVNGKIYSESFDVVKNGNEGSRLGKQFARELVLEMARNRIVLVCVAGMNYALQVESKGYNVITQSENEMRSKAEQLFKKLITKK